MRGLLDRLPWSQAARWRRHVRRIGRRWTGVPYRVGMSDDVDELKAKRQERGA